MLNSFSNILNTQQAYYAQRNRPSRSSAAGFADMLTETQRGTQAGSGHKVYLKTDDMLYSGGNGMGLSFYIKYADDSSMENPIAIAKGVDENGNEFEKRININNIDPGNATLVEMRAFEAHHNIDRGNRLSSFSMSMSNMTLNKRGDFITGLGQAINEQLLLGNSSNATFYKISLNSYMEILRLNSKNIL